MKRHAVKQLRVALTAAFTLLGPASVVAQPGGPPGPSGPARAVAPIDLTGQWVSIVTEDWRFRMITPPKGDFPGVPLTPAGRTVAEGWDAAKDQAEGNACKAYGAAGLMRIPGRLRISWRDDATLEIQADAGRQTRVLHFGAPPQAAEPTWQGVSKAEWLPHRAGGRVTNGTLKVVTTGLKPGYLRKNGVPYSADTVVTEYFDLLHTPEGSQWLVIKSIVEDPQYLSGPHITSSNFRKQSDRRGWDPADCAAQ